MKYMTRWLKYLLIFLVALLGCLGIAWYSLQPILTYSAKKYFDIDQIDYQGLRITPSSLFVSQLKIKHQGQDYQLADVRVTFDATKLKNPIFALQKVTATQLNLHHDKLPFPFTLKDIELLALGARHIDWTAKLATNKKQLTGFIGGQIEWGETKKISLSPKTTFTYGPWKLSFSPKSVIQITPSNQLVATKMQLDYQAQTYTARALVEEITASQNKIFLVIEKGALDISNKREGLLENATLDCKQNGEAPFLCRFEIPRFKLHQTQFQQISGELQSNLKQPFLLRSKNQLKLHIQAIEDFNTQFTNFGCELTFYAPFKVTLRNCELDLFDGHARVKQHQVSIRKPPYLIPVHITNVSLQHLFDVLEYKQLKVDGRLDGIVPISITPKGQVTISHSTLNAQRPGGMIQLKKENIETINNQSMKMMYQALENFEYESMNIDLQLNPQGKILGKIKLEGVSPALFQKKPIHFNINVEEDLDPLLKSLRYINPKPKLDEVN